MKIADPNSIDEKVFADINNSRQGMFIKGLNIDNPVILYLHGGMPDYFLTRKYPLNIEDSFTLAWWDQRGAGLSNRTKFDAHATLDQLIDDTVAVTDYLKRKFRKNKIYLMGHSGGTFLGIQVIHRFPELYNAYIGISQISYQLQSEILAVEYMLKEYEKRNDIRMLSKLRKIRISENQDLPREYLKIRDHAMHKLGIGTIRKMRNHITGIFLESLLFPEYTVSEKIALWKGKAHSGISQLWTDIINTDVSNQFKTFSIPVYLFHGKYDYTCSYELAKTYYRKIEAPVKGFYTFADSAHSPNFEEPSRMKEILINDVVAGRNTMSDTIE